MFKTVEPVENDIVQYHPEQDIDNQLAQSRERRGHVLPTMREPDPVDHARSDCSFPEAVP
jgi:hypothetical protein